MTSYVVLREIMPNGDEDTQVTVVGVIDTATAAQATKAIADRMPDTEYDADGTITLRAVPRRNWDTGFKRYGSSTERRVRAL